MSNALRALLVTPDYRLAGTFAELSRELGIEALPSSDKGDVSSELQRAKYEAVLLDFDQVPDAFGILARVRENPSSKTAVIFALVSDAKQRQGALQNGANLLFERPIEPAQIRRALRAAYDLMARERRRYFRCAMCFPVLLIPAKSEADFQCSSINVSSGGIALLAPVSLLPGSQAQVIFSLPGLDSLVRAHGTVIWDDNHGKIGLSFKCTDSKHQTDLDSWIDAQLGKMGKDEVSGGTAK